MPTSSGSGATDPAALRPGTPAAVRAPRAGYGAVFAFPEFRTVFAAHLISMPCEMAGGMALSVLVYRLTGSPLLSALTFATALLPYVIGGILLSAVADRYPARRVLVVCDLVHAGCVTAMAVPGMPVAALLALRCVPAAISPVFSGTRAATLGDIVGEGDLFVLGRSVIRITAQSAQLAGFAVGGLLLTAVSPRTVLVIMAAALCCSALLLRFGTRHRPARRTSGDGAGGALLGDSLRGVRQLFADRRVRALLLLSWVPPLFVVMPEALLTPFADAQGLGSVGLGLLMCGMPVGAVVSEVLAGSLLGPRGRARLTLPVGVLAALPAVGYAADPSFGWALALQVVTGFGIAYTLGLDQWFLAAVPEELRGRAMTVLTAGLMTAQGLGMAVSGAVAEFLPVHAVAALAGGCGALCSLVVALEVRRTVRRGGPGPGVAGSRGETGLTSI
ncbi:putative integral membrane protein [Streptomyces himastatinicus ATCC 53653]|uniref:Putative integral membrane protein n=1 Tax=Streptomyces himastatinicus ATCC 53653 TaxID=457427 RepID=D9WEB6_9ACTN|nr:MFS transporter [Streptomyces himastatinicus]EFL23155.1 putative integral membrane protein [Streptomyces himastatinicus ATCC 53653]